jgi:hypothetical protein
VSKKLKKLSHLIGLGCVGLMLSATTPKAQTELREWLVHMHVKQIELLKIEWGQPGFCGEWDRDYNPTTRSCGRRGKLIQRRY